MTGRTLSALGFRVLWRALGRDVLPYPLRHRFPAGSTVADSDRAWKAAATAVRRELDDALYGALRVLAEPEARVEVAGQAGERWLRAHAAVVHRHAVLLEQEPGPDPERGGPIRLSVLPVDALPGRVAALLPEASAGRGPGIEVTRHDLDDPVAEDEPFRLGADTRSSRDRAAAFFERPRTTVVHIAVPTGPAWDNRPTPARGFHVMDYPDGRYLVHGAGTLTAAPAARAAVRAAVARTLDAALRQHREERDPAYR